MMFPIMEDKLIQFPHKYAAMLLESMLMLDIAGFPLDLISYFDIFEYVIPISEWPENLKYLVKAIRILTEHGVTVSNSLVRESYYKGQISFPKESSFWIRYSGISTMLSYEIHSKYGEYLREVEPITFQDRNVFKPAWINFTVFGYIRCMKPYLLEQIFGNEEADNND